MIYPHLPNSIAMRARARRLPPTERRALLLACALRVFARRGLGEARHAEIAKEGGVSLSSVFFYFPTRAALVQAVLDEVERFYLDMAERIHGRTSPVPHVFWEHAVVFAQSVDSHPDYARVWLDWSTAIRDEVWPRYLDFQERLVQILQKTVHRGQRQGTFAADTDAEDVARFLVSSAHMVAQMKFTRCAPERVERFMRTVIRSAIGGLPSEGASSHHALSLPAEASLVRPSASARHQQK